MRLILNKFGGFEIEADDNELYYDGGIIDPATKREVDYFAITADALQTIVSLGPKLLKEREEKMKAGLSMIVRENL